METADLLYLLLLVVLGAPWLLGALVFGRRPPPHDERRGRE